MNCEGSERSHGLTQWPSVPLRLEPEHLLRAKLSIYDARGPPLNLLCIGDHRLPQFQLYILHVCQSLLGNNRHYLECS